jgi:hypothetical protein
MVYDRVNPHYAVAANHLSANAGAQRLGEAFARYNVFGGPTSITIFSDKLVFDFPTVLVRDYQTVASILNLTYDGLREDFEDARFETIDVRSAEHAQLQMPHEVEKYLERFRLNRIEPGASLGPVVQEFAGIMRVRSVDDSWQCRLAVEKSIAVTNGLFVDMAVTLRDAEQAPFAEKYEIFRRIAKGCNEMLGLSPVEEPQQ